MGGGIVTTEELFAKVYTQFKMHFYRAVFRNFENREATLTTVETFCMEVIHAMGRPTINEFASFLRMSSPNAAYKVNNLVRKGYLRRVRSEKDHREYYLEVTQRYIDYCNVSNSYVNDVMKRVRARMTDKEWADFYHTLEILSDEMKEDIPMEVKEPAI
jgi:DNA-binding MarR family transcriptional regulator